MAIDFRIRKHSIRATTIVEILLDGVTIGVIYPKEEQGIKLVSAHMSDQSVVFDDGSSHWPPIPAVLVDFDPSPYIIEDDSITKLKPE